MAYPVSLKNSMKMAYNKHINIEEALNKISKKKRKTFAGNVKRSCCK